MNTDKIRKDFPVLQRKINGKPIVYLDSACMSLKPQQVIAAMNEYYERYPACPRSSHKLGAMVTERFESARKSIAKFIGAKENEVIFTKNTTEGMNLVAHCLAKKGSVVLLPAIPLFWCSMEIY